MVAMFIGAIGVLDRTDMDHFASIFLQYQKRGKAEDEEKRRLDRELEPWTGPNGPGKKRVNVGPGHFSVRIVGVFDTVGSVGMPEELTLRSEKLKSIFGFPDKHLGHHVERAYQALALNETRADFNCAKFEQTPAGEERGQVLRQCWFAGSHCDIGGGFKEHDLSDLSLNWMIANVEDAISFDYEYVTSLPQPEAPWGTLPPHNPLTGIYQLAKVAQRDPPTEIDDVTHEVYHSSLLQQPQLTPPGLRKILVSKPHLVDELLPWELKAQALWDDQMKLTASTQALHPVERSETTEGSEFKNSILGTIRHFRNGGNTEDEKMSHVEYVNSWLANLSKSGSGVGAYIRELVG
ncbi:hypothetical protein C8Q74DRAFT_473232 [Fomes fomentarius]|nr:hypothetical protein C8Q74DRAFT_473232 [Fomes fomentarius]